MEDQSKSTPSGEFGIGPDERRIAERRQESSARSGVEVERRTRDRRDESPFRRRQDKRERLRIESY
jgi:hypothetical protein